MHKVNVRFVLMIMMVSSIWLLTDTAVAAQVNLWGSTTCQKRFLEPGAKALEEATGIKIKVYGVGTGKGLLALFEGKTNVAISSNVLEGSILSAQKVRTLIRNDFEKVFESCDAILAPVSPTTAYRIGEKTDDPLQMYLGDIFTATANLAGICGLSVPCGLTSEGLPVGLQILGPAFKEENILKVAPMSRCMND